MVERQTDCLQNDSCVICEAQEVSPHLGQLQFYCELLNSWVQENMESSSLIFRSVNFLSYLHLTEQVPNPLLRL